ncbi:TAXI family TRAP transporter solute-binding subunit [Sinirhodobacter sp. WL0062]|uniref:TAXI family TRAP transporter solute-binding subunit n=1 Tax=Rhodobacter flavimaris TaxID=2907145 RepID=A0ABS8YYY6_9RHOB|nr:TAXI family TRAP transporter solute-binding subunit [Sinirhodobacter sp. WL0062]MCE5973832.1 TAXI family TRAP transporter solute-binding subunit [Sinirhodobacter sp. WL0062]
MIRNFLGRASAAALMTGLIVFSAGTASAQEVRIGAMREGTSWYIFAATLEQMVEPILGANSVEVIARGGGVANPMVVQQGKAEIALSNVATAKWAYEGNPVYEGASAPDIRSLVGGLNNVYIGVMATQSFIDAAGTTDLAEIIKSGKGFRLLLKPTGSSSVPAAELILQADGSSFEALKASGGDVIQVAESQIADSIRNGNADIYVDTMIKGHPTITEVNLTADTVFLDIPQEGLDLLAANGLTPGKYGPWFDDQKAENTGANLGTVLIANASLSDDTAYLITKTLIENAAELGEAHAAWKAFDPKTAFLPENTGVPLHPGAERYYREIGLIN